VIRARLHHFYTWSADTDIPEVHRLAGTSEAWWLETLLFLKVGSPTGVPRAVNRIIKDTGPRACGFRNPRDHRRRVRLICARRRHRGKR
jgi:transposase